MDERDGWIIIGCILLLTISSILKSRMIGTLSDHVIEHDKELEFLRATMTAMSERTE